MSEREIVSALLFACTECGHRARMYMYPGKYAGIWECTNPECGASDSCDHEDRRIESTQVDYWPTPDIDRSYDVDVYVCNTCECTIDRDVADPAQDAADYMINAQIDYMRGK